MGLGYQAFQDRERRTLTPNLRSPKKDALMVPSLLDAIQSYTEAVLKKEIRCDLDACPRCGGISTSFKLHDRRKRTFLVVIERLVHQAFSLLTRWKCCGCRQTFTLYPDFAVPHKRYVRGVVFELSQRYVEEDRLSYRAAVRVEGMPVCYDSPEEGKIDDRTLAPSTLWRWLVLFSRLSRTLQEAFRLIRARSAASSIFRQFLPVAPWKYRSETRREILESSLRLLRTEEEYRQVFGVSIFPRLATVCSWR
jgi:hypothetical protein